MNLIVIIAMFAITAIILWFIYDINIKKFKNFAIEEEKRLNQITDKLPQNREVCENILKELNNDKVKIEENNNYESSLYIAVSDKIIIANTKGSYTRIQTIAHECLHSIQNRKMLMFNFIFSNLYIIYYIIASVLGIFNIIQNKILLVIIFIILSYIYYFIRSYLENDAMIKARYVAEKYIKDTNLLTEEETKQIVESYDKLNENGIKTTNYSLMLGTILKTIILSIFCF